MTDASYYLEHPEQFDSLSDDDKDRILAGGTIDLQPESSQAIEDNDDDEVNAAEASSSDPADDQTMDDDDEPEIMQKSGKGTIPYSALEEARRQAQQWREIAEQKDQMLAQLQAAKQQDAETGTTDAQDAVIAEYESLFPEVADDLKPLIEKMIQDGVKAGLEKLSSQFESRVAPVEQRMAQQWSEQNDQAILAVHPDFVEFANKPEFAQFVQEHPFIIDRETKMPLNTADVWSNFNAREVNELLRQAKEQAGYEAPRVEQSAKPKVDVNAKIASAKSRSPGTFSDIPAGKKDPVNDAERIANMSDAELERYMLSMTEAQRNDFMARLA